MSLNTIPEKILDHLPYVYAAASASIYGCLKRLVALPLHLIQTLSPNFYSSIIFGKGAVITPESIEGKVFEKINPKVPNPTKEKLYYVLKKADELAKKMGLQQPLKIYTSDSGTNSACGHKLAFKANAIFINYETLNDSEERIDFTLAHEISHIANSDMLWELAFTTALIALDIFVGFTFSPFLIPLIEGIGAVVEKKIHQQYEIGADKRAYTHLETSVGGLKSFKGYREKALQKRAEFVEKHQSNLQVYLNEKTYKGHPLYFSPFMRKLFYKIFKQTVVTSISPEGNYRPDMAHPTVTKRIQMAEAFATK